MSPVHSHAHYLGQRQPAVFFTAGFLRRRQSTHWFLRVFRIPIIEHVRSAPSRFVRVFPTR